MIRYKNFLSWCDNTKIFSDSTTVREVGNCAVFFNAGYCDRMTLKLLQASGKTAKEFRRRFQDARMLPCVACSPDKNSLLSFVRLSEGCNGLAVITPQD